MTALINNTKKNNYTNINYSNKFILLHNFFLKIELLDQLNISGLNCSSYEKKIR